MRGLFGLLLMCQLSMLAQHNTIEEWNKAYPADEVIQLEDHVNLELYFKSDSLKAKYHEKEKYLIISDRPMAFSKLDYENSTFRKLNYYKTTVYPDFDKPKKKRVVKDYQTISLQKGMVFYDDVVTYQCSLLPIQNGSSFEKEFEWEVSDTRFLPSFYMNSRVPNLNGLFQIKVPLNVQISYKVLNADTTQYSIVEKLSRKSKTITIQFNPEKSIEFEEHAPSRLEFSPQVVVRVLSYQDKKGDTIFQQNSVADLYQHYYGFTLETEVNEQAIKNLADSLIRTKEDDGRSVKEFLYQWVQQNIAYLAIEDGYNGYIPMNPELVFESRYGDCKGMSFLLHQLYKSQGIESHIVWVGTREIPYKFSEFTCTAISNHMILSVFEDDGTISYLDPTNEYLPYGVPSAFILGKEALIAISKDSFLIDVIQNISSQENYIIDSVQFAVSGNSLKGKGRIYASAYLRDPFFRVLRKNNKEKQLKQLSNLLNKGNAKFILHDFEILSNIHDNNDNVYIDYEFEYPDILFEANENKYLQLSFIQDQLISEEISKKRKLDLLFDFSCSYKYVFDLIVPEEFQVKKYPEDFKLHSDFIFFSQNFIPNQNSVLKAEYELGYSTIRVPSHSIPQMNEDIQDIKSYLKQHIKIGLND